MVRGAREHNLKNIAVAIPRNRLTVITGLSGSGKSSLAFDTIYAEGQRRYVESLSAYARQFLGLMEKPDVDAIEGLSPAISIEQKTTGQNPRSTVGTVTEIYDYLRLLWARVGVPHCPNDGTPGHAAERRADHRYGARLAGGDPDRGARAARAGAQGRVPRPVRGRAQARVRPRPRRRRDLRPRRGADAQPPAEPRHRGRGRPARGARGRPRRGSTTRSRRRSRRRTGVVRGRTPRRIGSRSASAVLRALRLPGVRPLAARARAAAVLLQLAVRRLSRLPRPRHPARGERRARPRRSQHLDPRGRDPAVGRADRLPAEGGAAHARARRSSSTSTLPGASTVESGQARAPARGAGPTFTLPDRRRPRPGRVRERVGRRPQERRAPLPRVQPATPCASARGVHGRAALPDLRRASGSSRSAWRSWCTAGASATSWTCRSSARSSSSRASRSARNGTAPGLDPGHRRADPQGSARPAPLPARRRPRLPDARAVARPRSRAARRSASGWPRRSDRGWWACSTSSTSRASGCTSATTSACSAPCAGCATWATR